MKEFCRREFMGDTNKLSNLKSLSNIEDLKDILELTPIDIGKWQSYEPYHSQEQQELQLDNLNVLPIRNAYGNIKFVYSTNIVAYERYIEEIVSTIKIKDTETTLETEVYYTSKIEGANTTLKRTQQIHNGSPIQKSNAFSEAMIKGNFEAVKLLNLYDNKITKDRLIKVWQVLTKDCRDNILLQGDEYRIGEVTVTGSSFVAVPCSELDTIMEEFISFYNSRLLDNHPFLKASIIHYAFETIHPFCDGNGRLGRLLINNYLIRQGIESAKAVSFSMEIDRSRGLYDYAFIASENIHGDCTPFLEYMLERMANAYYTASQV